MLQQFTFTSVGMILLPNHYNNERMFRIKVLPFHSISIEQFVPIVPNESVFLVLPFFIIQDKKNYRVSRLERRIFLFCFPS